MLNNNRFSHYDTLPRLIIVPLCLTLDCGCEEGKQAITIKCIIMQRAQRGAEEKFSSIETTRKAAIFRNRRQNEKRQCELMILIMMHFYKKINFLLLSVEVNKMSFHFCLNAFIMTSGWEPLGDGTSSERETDWKWRWRNVRGNVVACSDESSRRLNVYSSACQRFHEFSENEKKFLRKAFSFRRSTIQIKAIVEFG